MTDLRVDLRLVEDAPPIFFNDPRSRKFSVKLEATSRFSTTSSSVGGGWAPFCVELFYEFGERVHNQSILEHCLNPGRIRPGARNRITLEFRIGAVSRTHQGRRFVLRFSPGSPDEGAEAGAIETRPILVRSKVHNPCRAKKSKKRKATPAHAAATRGKVQHEQPQPLRPPSPSISPHAMLAAHSAMGSAAATGRAVEAPSPPHFNLVESAGTGVGAGTGAGVGLGACTGADGQDAKRLRRSSSGTGGTIGAPAPHEWARDMAAALQQCCWHVVGYGAAPVTTTTTTTTAAATGGVGAGADTDAARPIFRCSSCHVLHMPPEPARGGGGGGGGGGPAPPPLSAHHPRCAVLRLLACPPAPYDAPASYHAPLEPIPCAVAVPVAPTPTPGPPQDQEQGQQQGQQLWAPAPELKDAEIGTTADACFDSAAAAALALEGLDGDLGGDLGGGLDGDLGGGLGGDLCGLGWDKCAALCAAFCDHNAMHSTGED
eukprot:g3270.t1